MEAVQIIVEGAGDVLFVMRLLMKIEPKLVGRWKKCPYGDTMDESQFQPATLTMKAECGDRLIVLRAMNGISNIFPLPEDVLKTLPANIDGRRPRIIKTVIIVDADDSARGNGTGGIVEARRKINDEKEKCRKHGIDCAGFAMPNDQSDGTLENLLEGMIPLTHRKIIDCCWRNFEGCARTNGAKYDPPLKSMIDVYSKLFNRDANQGMFASCSFKDNSVWDWNASILEPLKRFLDTEVLQLGQGKE